MGLKQSNVELLLIDNNSEGIKSLCHEGADLECVDKEGRTPLILACTNAELFDVAKTLLDSGSNVNAYHSGRNGGTPLHHAANRGLESTVKLLLSHDADPMALNDDFETPLDIARAKGYSRVVRAIENHICSFSGWMRQIKGHSFLELFAPQLLSRRVWVVIIPTGSRNPTKPFKFELLVYASLEDAQPMTVMALANANLEEQCDGSVMIGPRRMREIRRPFVSHARVWARVDRQMRLKLAAETIGDMKQLNRFCDACKRNSQPMNPSMLMQTTTLPQNENAINAVDESNGSIQNPSVDGGSGSCVICLDASYEEEAVCVPCGHVAGCISCLKEVKDKKLGCPVCRSNIDLVIKLYHV